MTQARILIVIALSISAFASVALNAEGKKSFTFTNNAPRASFHVSINGGGHQKVAPGHSLTVTFDPEKDKVAYEFILPRDLRDVHQIDPEFLEKHDSFTYPNDHDDASKKQILRKKAAIKQQIAESPVQMNEALKLQ